MSKLIYDIDGVIVTYQKNFAETYAAEFGIDVKEIYEFFATDYHDCAIGRSALPDKLEKYVVRWNWPGSTGALIQYWFDCQSTIDHNLVSLIGAASAAGNDCYVASDQDAMRSAYLRKLLDFDSVFDGCFFSFELGVTKTETAFFERILNSLDCQPAEVFFWDDNPQNVATARAVGINAEIYPGYDEFRPSFSKQFGLAP